MFSADDDPTRWPVERLIGAYRDRSVSPVEIVGRCLEIAESTASLNAFASIDGDLALRRARECEAKYATDGSCGSLLGVPLGVKDLFGTDDFPTRCGSAVTGDGLQWSDARVVARLREAGAIVIGKTRTHEFGWGITSYSDRFGATRNPWNPGRSPGGSSGGSAVALAVGAVMIAVGSDTGGSIRIPAGYCGVCGLKPTWGRLSADGVFPLAPSLDHPGAMARWPADLRTMLSVMDEGQGSPGQGAQLPRMRVGIAEELMPMPLRDGRLELWEQTLAWLKRAGHSSVSVTVGQRIDPVDVFGVIQRAEARLTHEQRDLYPERRDLYGRDVLARLEAAAAVDLRQYVEMTQQRHALARDLDRSFDAVEIIVSPVASCSPIEITDREVMNGLEAEFRAAVMPFTVTQDLTGHPSCVIGTGFDAHGVPSGVQFTGPRGADHAVIAFAEEFEKANHAAWRMRALRSERSTTDHHRDDLVLGD
jgi:aspartyl-tRNA(Asn)/glutamyl-tRNA(Gln) amidotransferase subunit A